MSLLVNLNIPTWLLFFEVKNKQIKYTITSSLMTILEYIQINNWIFHIIYHMYRINIGTLLTYPFPKSTPFYYKIPIQAFYTFVKNLWVLSLHVFSSLGF